MGEREERIERGLLLRLWRLRSRWWPLMEAGGCREEAMVTGREVERKGKREMGREMRGLEGVAAATCEGWRPQPFGEKGKRWA